MEKKVIPYGTKVGCTVTGVGDLMLAVVGDDGEGYIMIGGHLDPKPKEGDRGTITFLEIDREPFGYWSYEPEYNLNMAHIGDGVYVEFDGYYLHLRANGHKNPVAVSLEPQVLEALNAYYKRVTGK